MCTEYFAFENFHLKKERTYKCVFCDSGYKTCIQKLGMRTQEYDDSFSDSRVLHDYFLNFLLVVFWKINLNWNGLKIFFFVHSFYCDVFMLLITSAIISCYCSVAKLCPTLCDPVYCSMPGLPVLHYLLEFTQTHVHWVGDGIQPSHPLSTPSPLALSLFPASGSFPMSWLFV